MVSILSLIVWIFTILLFIPIKSHQLREKRKRRNHIAEFDVTTEETIHLNDVVHQASLFANKIGGKLETQLGRSYELLGHKMSDLGSQLEQNKDNLAKKATDIYTGPLADKTSIVYENFQNGYGKMGDRLSSILNWLGQNIIKIGHNTGSIIRSSFHILGDIIGNTVNKTEHLVGNGLIKSGEKVHAAAIDLQRTSHDDSEDLRHKFQETAPKFQQSINQAIDKLGEKLHAFGVDTETAGKVIEQHHFLDTFKQTYHK